MPFGLAHTSEPPSSDHNACSTGWTAATENSPKYFGPTPIVLISQSWSCDGLTGDGANGHRAELKSRRKPWMEFRYSHSGAHGLEAPLPPPDVRLSLPVLLPDRITPSLSICQSIFKTSKEKIVEDTLEYIHSIQPAALHTSFRPFPVSCAISTESLIQKKSKQKH